MHPDILDTLALSNSGAAARSATFLGLVEEFQNMKDSQRQSDNAGCNQKQVSGSNCAHQASRYRAAKNSAQSATCGNNSKESLALLESHTSLAYIQKVVTPMIEKTSSQTQKAPDAMGDSNLNICHQASKLTMNIPYTALIKIFLGVFENLE